MKLGGETALKECENFEKLYDWPPETGKLCEESNLSSVFPDHNTPPFGRLRKRNQVPHGR